MSFWDFTDTIVKYYWPYIIFGAVMTMWLIIDLIRQSSEDVNSRLVDWDDISEETGVDWSEDA